MGANLDVLLLLGLRARQSLIETKSTRRRRSRAQGTAVFACKYLSHRWKLYFGMRCSFRLVQALRRENRWGGKERVSCHVRR